MITHSLLIRALRRSAQSILLAGLLAVIIAVVGWTLYWNADQVMRYQLKERLRTIAEISAQQFSVSDIEKIQSPKDRTKPVFRNVVDHLKMIRDAVPGSSSAYIMRRSEDPHLLVFVADADSLDTLEESDKNGNGLIESNEQSSNPGEFYDVSIAPDMIRGFEKPTTDENITLDQWGYTISGYAPIRDPRTGKALAIIGIDMRADEYLFQVQSILPPIAFVLLLIGTSMFAAYLAYGFTQKRLDEWKIFDRERAGLMLLTFHQLGAPLTIFKWSVESLQNRPKDQSAEDAIKEHVGNMNSGISRMDEMLNDLKFAAQVQEGRVDVHYIQTDLQDIVMQVASESEEAAKDQGITIKADAPHALQGKTDPVLVADVLYQLLTNAINYGHRGGNVAVRARKVGRRVLFEIADDGAGIPPEDLTRLFGKFVRGSNAPRFKPDGNGLGLFISRGLVEALGGTMSIRSTYHKGTTVTFTIPLR